MLGPGRAAELVSPPVGHNPSSLLPATGSSAEGPWWQRTRGRSCHSAASISNSPLLPSSFRNVKPFLTEISFPAMTAPGTWRMQSGPCRVTGPPPADTTLSHRTLGPRGSLRSSPALTPLLFWSSYSWVQTSPGDELDQGKQILSQSWTGVATGGGCSQWDKGSLLEYFQERLYMVTGERPMRRAPPPCPSVSTLPGGCEAQSCSSHPVTMRQEPEKQG